MAENAKKKKNTAEMEIVVDDGRKRVPIKNLNGDEIGVFYFNPTDFGILARYKEIENSVDKITEPLENIGINQKGEGISDEDVAALKEAEKRLDEMIDYLFGGNASEAFFGSVNPFSPIDGTFYCINVLDKVGDFITNAMNAEVEKQNERVGKYTDNYKK